MRAAVLSLLATAVSVVFAGDFNVRDFGAKGDGESKDTAALQKAIDKCSTAGGGRVVLPAGTYLCGSVYIKSGVELHLEKGAAILGSPDLSDYCDMAAYPQNWGSKTEGWGPQHLLLAIEQKNVAITGAGTVDGNGRAFFDMSGPRYVGTTAWRWGAYGAGAKGRPGQTIVFVESEGVRVEGVTFRDMTCWSCLFHGCANVKVKNVTVRNDIRHLNTDGFDVDSCRDVEISGCDIETGDDAFAVRGSPSRLKNKDKACEDVYIHDCRGRVSACGVRVGVGQGAIRRVRFENLEFVDAGTGLQVQCCYGSARGGVSISDVVFKNVLLSSVVTGISVTGGTEGSSAPLENVSFEDVTIDALRIPIAVVGAGATRPRDIRFSRVHVRAQPVPVFNLRRPDGTFAYPGLDECVRVKSADGVVLSDVTMMSLGRRKPATVAKEDADVTMAEACGRRVFRAICKQGYHGPDAPGVTGNSLEAFKLAWKNGARLIETDCWMIKSGRIICVHDPKVLKQKSGEWHPSIRELSDEDVARIDIGRSVKSSVPVRMPYIEEVFASMPKYAVAQCELCGYTDAFADEFDRLRRESGLSETNIVLSGANRNALVDFKKRYPKYRTLLLNSKFLKHIKDKAAFGAWLGRLKADGISILCPNAAQAMKAGLSRAEADQASSAGIEMRVWGVNSPELLKYAVSLGVTAATCGNWKDVFAWAADMPDVEVTP